MKQTGPAIQIQCEPTEERLQITYKNTSMKAF